MKNIVLFLFLLIQLTVLGQIEISEETQNEIKEINPIPKKPSNSEIYFVTNWSTTNRSLTENEGLFSDSLGTRADETSLNTWSFGLGMRNRLNKYLGWEGGIWFLRNGESYLFEGSDSTYMYNSTYSYIGMPLKLSFLYGDDFQLIASAGLIPQMFIKYRQDIEWTDSNNTKDKETIKTNSGYSSFVMSAVFNVGGKVKFGDRWSLIVLPEYRLQLNSSYLKNDPYIHKGRAFGVTFGLTMAL